MAGERISPYTISDARQEMALEGIDFARLLADEHKKWLTGKWLRSYLKTRGTILTPAIIRFIPNPLFDIYGSICDIHADTYILKPLSENARLRRFSATIGLGTSPQIVITSGRFYASGNHAFLASWQVPSRMEKIRGQSPKPLRNWIWDEDSSNGVAPDFFTADIRILDCIAPALGVLYPLSGQFDTSQERPALKDCALQPG